MPAHQVHFPGQLVHNFYQLLKGTHKKLRSAVEGRSRKAWVVTRNRAGPGFAFRQSWTTVAAWLSQRCVGDGRGRGGSDNRKTRGKRVRLSAPVWAVGWGPGRMSGMQRQGTECGKASEAWLLSSCSPGDLSAQACQVSQSPRPSYAPQDLLIVQTRITLWWIPRGETGKSMGGQPWPNPLLHWKANPVNPLDTSSG